MVWVGMIVIHVHDADRMKARESLVLVGQFLLPLRTKIFPLKNKNERKKKEDMIEHGYKSGTILHIYIYDESYEDGSAPAEHISPSSGESQDGSYIF